MVEAVKWMELHLNKMAMAGMLTHFCNPNTQEVEAEGS
jgi:hypothetical protein